MSKFLSESYASKAADEGVLLGTLSATAETKGAWSELYYYDGKLISVMYSDYQNAWLVGGTEIDENEIEKNVDDPKAALEILNSRR